MFLFVKNLGEKDQWNYNVVFVNFICHWIRTWIRESKSTRIRADPGPKYCLGIIRYRYGIVERCFILTMSSDFLNFGFWTCHFQLLQYHRLFYLYPQAQHFWHSESGSIIQIAEKVCVFCVQGQSFYFFNISMYTPTAFNIPERRWRMYLVNPYHPVPTCPWRKLRHHNSCQQLCTHSAVPRAAATSPVILARLAD